MIKRLTWLVWLIIVAASASAANMTLNQLIESYNYDFYGGGINVTFFDDYMLDNDGNGLNDTLTINLTTNASGASTYLFIVSLNGKDSLIKNYTNKTVSSSDKSAQVSFSTRRLSLKQYNYSAEVRRQDYSLSYAKYKVQTDYYQTYEQGISIISISDQTVNNDALRITLNLNVTENKTANITGYLKYSNKTISATKQVALATPSQLVNVDFDNETVKSTHYQGVYSLESIRVGDRVLDADYNTSSYDYKAFAKTSYIRNITSETFDNNSNNLSEALRFNFTLNITSGDTYSLEAALYTSDDEYVTTLAKNVTLAAGVQTVLAEVVGKTIYSTYHTGQFKFSFARLSVGNVTKDIMYDALTTNSTFYSDFERPPLPDLRAAILANFSAATNTTNISINVTNSGNATAFNIIVDVFDNVTYENMSSFSILNFTESRILNFLAFNTTNNSFFMTIVDFDNLVDESNESNNVADNKVEQISLKISSLSQIYSNVTRKVFEFVIENNGTSAVNNVTWRLNLGDGTVINSTYNASLAVGDLMLVYFDYNYSTEGQYLVTANASAIAEGVTDIETLSVSASGALSVTGLKVFYSNLSQKVFEFSINNNDVTNFSVNWTLNLGDGNVVSSVQNTSLNSTKSLLVYVYHNYTAQGDYSVTATAQGGGLTASSNIPVEVEYVGVSNFSVINSSGALRTFEAYVKNYMAVNLTNVSWSMDTGTGDGVINSKIPVVLRPQEGAFVYVSYSYTGTGGGTFTMNFSAVNNSWKDWELLNVTIT